MNKSHYLQGKTMKKTLLILSMAALGVVACSESENTSAPTAEKAPAPAPVVETVKQEETKTTVETVKEKAAEKVEEVKEKAAEKVEEVKEKAAEKVDEVKESVKDTAADKLQSLKDKY